MLVSAKKIEIPNNCPEGCRFAGCIEQGGPCFRCPVLNCRGTILQEKEFREIAGPDEPYPEGGYLFRLINPEDYRDDWAIEWAKFFRGEIESPELKLMKERQDDGVSD